MQRTDTYLAAGFLLRIGLPIIWPALIGYVANAVEISTPITSFKSLQESFFYLENEIELYDGGVVHHPPLLVLLLSLINDFPGKLAPFGFHLLYACVDVLIARRLVQINDWYTPKKTRFSDDVILVVYLFNPLILLSTISKSTIIFTNFAIIEGVAQLVLNKNVVRSVFMISIAGYLSYYPWYLIVPLVSLYGHVTGSSRKGVMHDIGVVVGLFGSFVGLLLFLSYNITKSFNFITYTYGTIIKFDTIAPNLGLWWYFFTEMFEFFTPFFLGVFNLYSVLFVLPLTMRFNRDPLFAFLTSYGMLVFGKSYPSIADIGFVLSTFFVFKPIFKHCSLFIISALLLIHAFCLSPIFYYLWIYLGGGNSNFFYAINLVYGLGVAALISDLIWGKITSEYYEDNGLTEDSEIRLTQI